MQVADPVEGHTSKSVDQSLHALRLHAVEMGGLVIDQVGTAVKALLDRDARLADLVLSRESLVNDYDGRLDHDSLTFIALQQPVANDLRMARAVARSGLELERVGDEAKKIARFAMQIGSVSAHDPVVAVARYLRHMADLSVAMLRSAVRALDESSAGLAHEGHHRHHVRAQGPRAGRRPREEHRRAGAVHGGGGEAGEEGSDERIADSQRCLCSSPSAIRLSLVTSRRLRAATH